MNDYRTAFEEQLVQASRRLAADRRGRRRRYLRPTIALPVTLAIFAGTGVAAITHPWSPLLGDPTLPGPAPTITSASPPADQLAMLGVLRRPAEPRDRDPETKFNLRFLSGTTTAGVETDFIRRLATLPDGAAVTLIPVQSWRLGADERALTNALCVIYPDIRGHGVGKACFDSAAIRAGNATASIGDQTFGLVPDDVRGIKATYADGTVVRAPVRDNFFSISPDGSRDIGSPGPSRPKRVDGLDENGDMVVALTP
jgi:hypothetical protein